MARGFWFTAQATQMLEEKGFSKIPSLHSMFMREDTTVVTEEREFHYKPQNY